MRKLSLFVLAIIATTQTTWAKNAVCVVSKNSTDVILRQGDEENAIQKIQVSFDNSTVSVKFDNAGEPGSLSGTFTKSTANYYLYDSADLNTDWAGDQTDFAYIKVSKELHDGQKGTVQFSYRQVGDSEGATWFNQTYNCSVVYKK